jgi:hypothetical protein
MTGSAKQSIHPHKERMERMDCVASAALRKGFAFVAGNDELES